MAVYFLRVHFLQCGHGRSVQTVLQDKVMRYQLMTFFYCSVNNLSMTSRCFSAGRASNSRICLLRNVTLEVWHPADIYEPFILQSMNSHSQSLQSENMTSVKSQSTNEAPVKLVPCIYAPVKLHPVYFELPMMVSDRSASVKLHSRNSEYSRSTPDRLAPWKLVLSMLSEHSSSKRHLRSVFVKSLIYCFVVLIICDSLLVGALRVLNYPTRI